MTKLVRIENADTNDSKTVVVEIWDETNGVRKILHVSELLYPTHLREFTLSSNRYIIVRETDKIKIEAHNRNVE
jgi:hypothetical protein